MTVTKVIPEKKHLPTFNELFQVIDFTYLSIGQADIYRKKIRHSALYESLQKFLYWFGFFNLAYLVVGETLYGIDVLSSASIANFLAFTELMPCVILSIFCLSKTLNIAVKREQVNKIFEELEEMWPGDNPNSREIVYQCMVPTRKYLFIYTVMTNILAIIFNCFPMLIMLYDYLSGDNFQLLIPYFVVYPFDWKSSIELYIVIYITNMYGGFFTTAGVSSVDCFFCILMAHLCMHFQILCLEIEKLADHDEELVEEKRAEEEKRRLQRLVLYHQQIMRLGNEVQDVFSFVLFINTVISSFSLCILTFAMTISPLSRLIKYFIFFSSSTIQILMVSWYGDNLMTDSEAVKLAAYSCNWPDASLALRKSILMLEVRGSFPESINVMGFTKLSRMTFSSILRVAWSYFTLMRTMYQQIISRND